MQDFSRYLVEHARDLAVQVDARAVVICADSLAGDEEVAELLRQDDFQTILVTRSKDAPSQAGSAPRTWVTVPDVHLTRAGQVKAALLIALARGVLKPGDRVVCLTGIDRSELIDTLIVLNLGTEPEFFRRFDATMFSSDVSPEVFERTLTLATQLAAQGREGRPVGSIFVVGDAQRVLAHSRNLVLNPFRGYPESERNILDPAIEETIKEFSAIDGAFVISGDGVLLTAGAQLLPTAVAPPLPNGLGTRHAAAAAITVSTSATAIVISQSTGMVSVFKSGQMVADLNRAGGSGSEPAGSSPR